MHTTARGGGGLLGLEDCHCRPLLGQLLHLPTRVIAGAGARLVREDQQASFVRAFVLVGMCEPGVALIEGHSDWH